MGPIALGVANGRLWNVEEMAVNERGDTITVLLADDNLLVREGVRALLGVERDLEVVGTAADFDELVAAADATRPQVVVTDIRMPPTFQDEGIEAAKLVRKRHPGTGIVVLSQYDEPEYAISLLHEGAAGYAYLLKDRVADGDRLARAIREVATGGSMLDPEIVAALVSPVRDDADLTAERGALLHEVAEGRPVKAIAARRGHDARGGQRRGRGRCSSSSPRGDASGRGRRSAPAAPAAAGDPRPGGAGRDAEPACSRAGWPRSCAPTRRHAERTERLTVTVLMSDVRGYSAIAERTDPTVLAGQLDEHRAEMNAAILAEGGTVMQYVGDAVMAVFGAPVPQDDHAVRARARGRARCTRSRTRSTAVGRAGPGAVRAGHRAVDR